MRKVFCRLIVVDLNMSFAKLDGDKLSLIRIPLVANQILGALAFYDELIGFEEMPIVEFVELCKKQATEEEVKKFEKSFGEIYS